MSWLTSVIEYLNENSGAITAATTVVLVGITWWYVRITKDILQATNKPKVILFLRYSHRVITLCVQNIGTGYASDVEFGDNLSFKTIDRFGREGKVLEDIEPFKSGINFLGAGHKIDTSLCDGGDVRNLEKRSFNILVSYKDSAGKTFKQLFPFDLGNWGNTSQFITPYTDNVANAIEKVAGQLEQMTRRSLGRDSRNNFAQSILRQNDPEVTALQRIADALDRIAPEEKQQK